jgi:hypothetical protein
MYKICIGILSILTFVSCENKHSLSKKEIEKLVDNLNSARFTKQKTEENDTFNIMRTLVDTSFLKKYLLGNGALFKNHPFSDSVIFNRDISFQNEVLIEKESPIYQTETNITKFFPKDLKVKFMTERELLVLANKLFKDEKEVLQYLEIYYFKKAEQTEDIKVPTYVLTLRRMSISLKLDTNGLNALEKIKKKELKLSDKEKCKFSVIRETGENLKFYIGRDSLISTLN